MSKADTLLKKATFFERLALYSDRKYYLQALAQNEGVVTYDPRNAQYTDSEIKASLSNVSNALVQWSQQYGKRITDASASPRVFPDSINQAATVVVNAARQSNFDNATLSNVGKALAQLSAARLPELDSDARSAFNSMVFPVSSKAQEQVSKTLEMGGAKPAVPKEDDSGPTFPYLKQMDSPAVPETEAPKAKPIPINRADQAAVAKFFNNLVSTGDIGAVANTDKMNDGVLGKETRKALEAIKDYFKRKNPQNARMSDQDVIRAAKLPGNIR